MAKVFKIEMEIDMKERFIKNLIKAVKDEKLLYDKRDPQYMNKFEKNRTWDRIGTKLGESEKDCQKKWLLLREKFARELRKLDIASENDADYIPSWPYFESLLFLKDYIKKRKTHINADIPEKICYDVEEVIVKPYSFCDADASSPDANKSESEPMMTQNKNTDAEVLSIFKNAIANLSNNTKSTENDEDELFMKNIVAMMKPIPMKEKDELKQKIFANVVAVRRNIKRT